MLKLIYGGDNPDIRYKTGFHFSDPVFFADNGKQSCLYLNALEIEKAKKSNTRSSLSICSLEKYIQESRKLKDETAFRNKLALSIIRSLKAKTILVSKDFPIGIADYLREKKVKLKITEELYPERRIKTQKEVRHIEHILKRMQEAFVRVETILKKSKVKGSLILYQGKPLTSEFLKYEIDLVFMKNGLESRGQSIVSSGSDAAMPHHRGEGKIKPGTTIVVDLFPQDQASGYFGDMTRTYVKGKPSDKTLKMYEVVREAQDEAFKKIKSGVRAKEVDQACLNVFSQEGFITKDGEGFIHSTGHGLGLELHERPGVGSGEEVLKEGNVITIEPGLYYRALGGVRIEDVILVTKTGYKNLTNYSHNFIIL